MKYFPAIMAAALLSTATASELELQPGQWSLNLKYINGGLNGNSETITNTDYDRTEKYNILFLTGEGHYAVNDTVTLGLYGYISRAKWDNELTNSGITDSEEISDFDLVINPTIAYKLNNNLSAYGSLRIDTDDANEVIDEDGDKSYNSEKFFGLTYLAGLKYYNEIKPNLLLETTVLAGIQHQKFTNPEDSQDTQQYRYLKTSGVMQGHYFLAQNFSVDLGFGLYFQNLLDFKEDGESLEDSDFDVSDFNYRTIVGFTYYHR